MAEEEKKEEKAKEGAGKSGGGMLLVIISAVNLLVSAGTIGFLFIHFKNAQKPGIEDVAEHGDDHDGGNEEGKEPAEGGGGGHDGGHGEAKNAGGATSDERNFGKMIPLEEFTVNLATVGSVRPQFFRVKITLEVPNDDIEGEISQKMPKVRNAIIDLVNSKKPKDLATVEGRDHMKEEIKNALNAFLVTGKVSEVLFTNFALSS